MLTDNKTFISYQLITGLLQFKNDFTLWDISINRVFLRNPYEIAYLLQDNIQFQKYIENQIFTFDKKRNYMKESADRLNKFT